MIRLVSCDGEGNKKIYILFLFIVMDHKYKALLQNIPTRHVITAMAPVPDQAKQIEKLRNLDINNFFVLGTLSSISGILGNDFLFVSKRYLRNDVFQKRQSLNFSNEILDGTQ